MKIAEIYDEYYPLFHKKASVFTDSKEEIEDILHDAFVKVIIHKNQIENMDISESVPYICKVIKNTACDYAKKYSRYEAETVIEEVSDDVSPEEILLIQEDTELAKKCFKKLSEKDRKVLQLYFYEDYDYNQLSEALNIKTKNIRMVVCRAKARLIRNFRKEDKENG